MNTGIGFSEIILIFTLVLLLFGSKELPRFFREAGRLISLFRSYRDQIKSEFDKVTLPLESQYSEKEKKQQLRAHFSSRRDRIEKKKQTELSSMIHASILSLSLFNSSRSVMVYCSKGSEADTFDLIDEMLCRGKRVIVPFCRDGGNQIGIAEIKDSSKELVRGKYGIPEPLESLRDNFLKSDIDIVLCPGVAFDRYGMRLGWGGGYYDRFLGELKGKTPIIGLAFNCQISSVPLPVNRHDISVDEVITESGPLLGFCKPDLEPHYPVSELT
ncbi:5-formyltetrahydrofolate cyclo-ligase [Chitinispirillum alkaliphilum]|nr:5-formyltetrahydrofolate cyclo-ligase [Chitinispirillum alkaliphilum]